MSPHPGAMMPIPNFRENEVSVIAHNLVIGGPEPCSLPHCLHKNLTVATEFAGHVCKGVSTPPQGLEGDFAIAPQLCGRELEGAASPPHSVEDEVPVGPELL
mmetsp:Transcript_44300/g.134272  ORF Transcript_44300/g.134272 Transcript_44300/m.134272 type:complete len:102 (-) Transcript_44300:222-527(-)